MIPRNTCYLGLVLLVTSGWISNVSGSFVDSLTGSLPYGFRAETHSQLMIRTKIKWKSGMTEDGKNKCRGAIQLSHPSSNVTGGVKIPGYVRTFNFNIKYAGRMLEMSNGPYHHNKSTLVHATGGPVDVITTHIWHFDNGRQGIISVNNGRPVHSGPLVSVMQGEQRMFWTNGASYITSWPQTKCGPLSITVLTAQRSSFSDPNYLRFMTSNHFPFKIDGDKMASVTASVYRSNHPTVKKEYSEEFSIGIASKDPTAKKAVKKETLFSKANEKFSRFSGDDASERTVDFFVHEPHTEEPNINSLNVHDTSQALKYCFERDTRSRSFTIRLQLGGHVEKRTQEASDGKLYPQARKEDANKLSVYFPGCIKDQKQQPPIPIIYCEKCQNRPSWLFVTNNIEETQQTKFTAFAIRYYAEDKNGDKVKELRKHPFTWNPNVFP